MGETLGPDGNKLALTLPLAPERLGLFIIIVITPNCHLAPKDARDGRRQTFD